jgi:Putative zinc-finger
MGRHEEFLELCAAVTAGELSCDEQAKLDAHLALCPECREVMSEFEIAARRGVAAFVEEHFPKEQEGSHSSWSVEKAAASFFKRLDEEEGRALSKGRENAADQFKTGRRYTYRRSEIRWREVWMSFAAAVLLALALAIIGYKTGVKRGTDIVPTASTPTKGSRSSVEEQASDAGHERAQLLAKLVEKAKIIDDLKRQLSEQLRVVNAMRAADGTATDSQARGHQPVQPTRGAGASREKQLVAARATLRDLQETIDSVTAQREEITSRATALETKVDDLTQLVRDRERAIDQKESEVAKQQDLLDHDRDIRELMGARDLYIAEVHDVSRTGQTDKTYGRVFYTKGKSLIFYAYDLDAQAGVRNVSSFQAWGRRGPDKQQALNLGIFYEDSVSKKRWVLKAEDPKALKDIDAVFVTVEPNGGSHRPSGKPLLFAYLRVSPNHP